MSWIVLCIAGCFECLGAVALKSSDGFRDRRWSIVFVLGMSASMFLLSIAANRIPIGTAYAAWTGIGAVGTAMYGMVRLGESRARRRIVCLVAIVAGVVVLRVTDPVPPEQDAGPPAEVTSILR
ncbi:MAG: multidrug efflux SMR transporter [Phycisphaera sp.]|nr:multidrug efflux SMR transporter [Phycisphaera sp.]